jgi:hypothetical protein
MLESRLHRTLSDLIEHHAERRLGWLLRNDLFREMLADRLAFTIRVGGEINRFNLFCGLLKVRNDLFVVALFRIRNDLVFGLEVVLNVDTRPFEGRSLICPIEAFTTKSLPRYLLIVFALAGDSTTTRFFAITLSLRSRTDEASMTEGCFPTDFLCF